MKNLRLSETFNTILSMLCSAIPAIVSTCKLESFTGELQTGVPMLFLGYIASAICFVLLHNLFPKIFSFVRPLKNYEGYWLQIIPDLVERPFSILTFSFSSKQRGYYLCGTNYSPEFIHKVDFDANKFVETNSRNGFYYITNTTSEYKNGFGKISFVNSHYDCLTRASGYFFDSSNEACSKKYETLLIKCDRKFFKYLGQGYKHIRTKKLNPNEIMDLSKTFVQKELKNYREHFPDKCAKFNELPCHKQSK